MRGTAMKIYELTIAEYRETLRGKRVPHYYYNREGEIRAQQRDAVTHAIQCGQGIPEGVLNEYRKEYPVLARVYANRR